MVILLTLYCSILLFYACDSALRSYIATYCMILDYLITFIALLHVYLILLFVGLRSLLRILHLLFILVLRSCFTHALFGSVLLLRYGFCSVTFLLIAVGFIFRFCHYPVHCCLVTGLYAYTQFTALHFPHPVGCFIGSPLYCLGCFANIYRTRLLLPCVSLCLLPCTCRFCHIFTCVLHCTVHGLDTLLPHWFNTCHCCPPPPPR